MTSCMHCTSFNIDKYNAFPYQQRLQFINPFVLPRN